MDLFTFWVWVMTGVVAFALVVFLAVFGGDIVHYFAKELRAQRVRDAKTRVALGLTPPVEPAEAT
jgi:hypothetical protein